MKSFSKVWSDKKVKSIQDILSSKKINKTGRLSKSIKLSFSETGGIAYIKFSTVFYGKYVRKHYLKKGFDIFGPISQIKDLVKAMSDDYKEQVLKEVIESLNITQK